MKVTELQTPHIEARPRPKCSETGGGLKKDKSQHLQSDRFSNQELREADHQTCKLADEIRAMQVALVEYQLRESKWRQEDREWLKQKEAELMKKLQQFEEITKKVLQFVQLSDDNSTRPVAPSEGQQYMSEKASLLLCVASRRSIDGEEEITNESVSEIYLTDSEIHQQLKEADREAFKTAGEIRAIKSAVSEYHAHKENCIWMKEDTDWLEEKQTELMQKLAEFEEVTKRFLRYIGLADISTTQFVFPKETPGEVAAKAAVLKDNNNVVGEDEEKTTVSNTIGDELTPCSEVSIHEQITEADEHACKTAQEIQELKTEIDNYHKQIKSSEPIKQDAKWLERKKSELINKLEEFEVITLKVKHLVGLAELNTTKSLPVHLRSTPESENTNKEDCNGSTWVRFMVEQFFNGLMLFYYP